MGSIWDKPYYARRAETDALAKKAGVNRDDFIKADIDGERGMTNDSYKKYEQAIVDAKANDYDTRRSIEAAQMSGYEGADELGKGISNLKEASNAYDFLEGIHKDKLNNTGKFSSNNDYGNVTKYLINHDRDTHTQGIKDSFKDYMEENQTEAADDVQQQSKPIEYSDELKSAYSNVNSSQQQLNSNFDAANNPFAQAADNGNPQVASDGSEQRNQAAQAFSDNYKLNLMNGMKKEIKTEV